MLRKSLLPSDNISECVSLMLKGAKKRRAVALSAVKTINTGLGFAPNIQVVK